MATYATLPGTGDAVAYTSASPSITYTDSNLISSFGPIHAPRLYAEDLTALELASSGKIAFTLDDMHALDFVDGGDSTVYLRARDANSLSLITESSNVFLTLDEAADNLNGYADNLIDLESGSSASITAGSNIAMLAAETLTATAGSNIMISASNLIDLTAGSEISLTAPTWTVDASNITLIAQEVLTLGATGSNILVSGGEDMLVTIASNIDFEATAADFTASAGANLSLSSGAAASLTATTGLTLTSVQEGISLNADGDVTMQSLTDGNIVLSVQAAQKQIFQVGGMDIIQIYKTDQYDADSASNLTDHKIVLNADVEIMGTLNSTSITETILEVEDKLIHLAFSSNIAAPSDGTTNEGAGIIVDGLPAGGDSNIYDRYEKSLRWHHNTGGVRALGDSNIEEAYWELRGGGLRIAHTAETTGDELSFGFRLNQMNELELVKHVTPFGGSTTSMRVAKFGRTIA